ncbi:acyl-CoA dehydratase activase-related protein [Brevibacillus humidisoli]|uniref:BadF/BadG/BcrA/BcrD ATPase family protein n=1 Tax=Brevibacillus humidisoli TaxID=2895522 RepID=UPI001E3E7CE4|nr:BadF/BadG/BcrA/BcrD ATPase family protein [Brevibacillus humidisoli]UFJ42709.1 acyl-CoA dehydratase activase-related protein [Brevibacillus humidisoli]
MESGEKSFDSLIIGIDVGSTTVKATVVNPANNEILWSDYQRHHTKQAEKVLEFLITIGNQFASVPQNRIRVFVTGSGAGPIAEHIGAKFVQEVNAVTMAVERLHPDVGSVIELGGQDAKIIIFKTNQETGDKQALTSMNDKCASGTGATIDKCMIKVGMPIEEVGRLHFDDSKLHHVAAKCGVFAETDIVNLVKSGIPSAEIMCSLADAIVMQNLSVLTRGNTLRHRVLLLGGPNTYLPFLQECWRKRIPESWEERGYAYPKDIPLEELIFVPENSQYYAAYGAVMYGMHEPADVGIYTGLEGLKNFIAHGRKAKLGEKAGPPLVDNVAELDKFRQTYSIPKFTPAEFKPGQKVKAVIGLDGGSTSSKAVLVDESGTILLKEYQLSKGNPLEDTREMLKRIRDKVTGAGAELEIIGFGATGYAADVLEKTLQADVNIVETVAHMMSAVHQFGDVDVICDIGGQDIKVLFLKNRDIRNFRLSNQCSAGNGMLLQAMADQFGIPIQEYAYTAFKADLSPKFSYGCAVFLDADRVNFQKEGYSKEELLAGLAMVLPKNVWQYVVQIPRMAELGRKFVLQGGTQYNLAAVKAQVDYIKERVPDAEVYVHPHPGEAGAIGAAMETLRVVKRRGYSTFLGLDAAIYLNYVTRNDESTRCNFCPNHCSRTFIDSKTPDGQVARYISGFSCEKGTVEDKEAVVELTKKRQALKKHYPNLVEYEAQRMYQHFYDPEPMPEGDAPVEDFKVKRALFGLGGMRKTAYRRSFQRSSKEAAERRSQLRIGIPRVLNIWSTAPFWRTYFETLGIDKRNIVFSDFTSEEMWQEGGKYGSIDPCYPSKVAQAHIHNLLFKHHERKALNYIFFPCITHIPTHLQNVVDSASCPIVAGAPNVIKAAFTKEVNFFETRGVTYLDPAVTFTELHMMKQQLYQAFQDELEITEDESDFAVEQAWQAMNLFDAEMQERGKVILEQVEEENRIAILMIGRPYHSDPGLNHGVLEEFQVLGYPILSMRSIPKDEAWLRRFFRDDLENGRVEYALDVTDVWPENFSSNSVQKVWAAKFAARHPNVAVLDLSSFKCGHDAPTYGLIDSIISTAGTPYSALHDIDANKPSGSIKIRVKTYAHSLGLHEERLEDLARKKAELQRLIEEKRMELFGRSTAETRADETNQPQAEMEKNRASSQ